MYGSFRITMIQQRNGNTIEIQAISGTNCTGLSIHVVSGQKQTHGFYRSVQEGNSHVIHVGAGGAGELDLVVVATGLEDLLLKAFDEIPFGRRVHIQRVHDMVAVYVIEDRLFDIVVVVTVVHGPGAGEEGGAVLYRGVPSAMKDSPLSVTARYL